MRTLQAALAGGQLKQPHRYRLDAPGADEQDLAILSTNGAAQRLGVSDNRVRELKKTDPTFPRPFPIPGAAGDFYRTADIDEYVATRKLGVSEVGRPRASDEPRLRVALQAMIDHSTILTVAKAQLRYALDQEGGRYVRGKALLLVRQPPGHLREVENALSGDARQEFRATLERAREIAGE
jgi:hypothetical protein